MHKILFFNSILVLSLISGSVGSAENQGDARAEEKALPKIKMLSKPRTASKTGFDKEISAKGFGDSVDEACERAKQKLRLAMLTDPLVRACEGEFEAVIIGDCDTKTINGRAKDNIQASWKSKLSCSFDSTGSAVNEASKRANGSN